MVRAHSLGRLYATLALNRYEAGDLAAATRYLARGVATQQVVGECAGCDALLYPVAVPVYIAHGDLALAEQACRKAEEVASAFRSRSWVATARYLLGLLASAQGDDASAVLHLEQAAAIFEELGQPYETARTLEVLAVALKRHPAGNADRARAVLAKAAGQYTALGAEAQARRVLATSDSL
jgi:tetratricopeptide (TPR) repeat protein